MLEPVQHPGAGCLAVVVVASKLASNSAVCFEQPASRLAVPWVSRRRAAFLLLPIEAMLASALVVALIPPGNSLDDCTAAAGGGPGCAKAGTAPSPSSNRRSGKAVELFLLMR